MELMVRPVVERVAVSVEVEGLLVQWRVVVTEERVVLLPSQPMVVRVVEAELVALPLVLPVVKAEWEEALVVEPVAVEAKEELVVRV